MSPIYAKLNDVITHQGVYKATEPNPKLSGGTWLTGATRLTGTICTFKKLLLQYGKRTLVS